jgi:hypothetical protein
MVPLQDRLEGLYMPSPSVLHEMLAYTRRPTFGMIHSDKTSDFGQLTVARHHIDGMATSLPNFDCGLNTTDSFEQESLVDFAFVRL